MSESHALTRLFERAAVQPDAAALLSPGHEPLSFGQLKKAIEGLGEEMRRLGVTRHDRVAVVCPPGPETAIICLGVIAGATCVPLNPDHQQEELRHFLRAMRVGRVLLGAGLVNPVRQVAADLDIPVNDIVFDRDAAALSPSIDQSATAAAGSEVVVGPPRADDTALVLHTSGSTAAPKIVPLSHRQLLASARNITDTLGLTRSDRCLNMLPLFHVGGLLDLLLVPLSAGGAVAITGPLPGRHFFDAVTEFRPTWFQVVPTMLRDIVDHALASELPGGPFEVLRFIRSVSSPLDTGLLEQAEAVFRVPVLEMYGMSETCGQIASNPLPPGRRKPGSVGLVTGVELRCVDETGNPAGNGSRGEILVRGDTVITAYEGEERSRNFIADWLRTGDEGYLDDEGYLFLSGRIKDIINRGGEKISPAEIDLWLARHPAVRDCAAFAMPHTSLGEEVVAAVVLEPGAAPTDQELRLFAAGKIAPHKVPQKIFRLDELPRAPGGKLQRHRLAAMFGASVPSATVADYSPPHSDLSRGLAAMWEQALGVERVGLRDNFFELGGDSLSAAAFLEDFEASHQVSLPGTALFDAPTVEEFEKLLLSEGFDYRAIRSPDPGNLPDEVYAVLLRRSAAWRGRRAHPDSLVIGHNTLGTRQPVFWSADSDRWLSGLGAGLGPDQPVYIMRNAWGTGVFTRDRALLEGTARHFVGEILDLQPEGPYILGGFCEGAKVAAEAARELLKLGHRITLLCLVEHSITKPFDGQVAHYVGRRNRLSPYYLFEHPESGWRKLFPGDPTVSVFPWVHDDFMREDCIRELASRMEADIARARQAQDTLPQKPPLQLLQPEDYRSRLRFQAPRWLTPRHRFPVRVAYRNCSDVTWRPTPESGISVYARWVNYRGGVILSKRIAQLERPLAPGGEVALSLNLRAPNNSGRWLLEVGLVDEGITWFGERGHGLARKRVYAYQAGELRRRFRDKLLKAVQFFS
jgi:acyl-CoA synthetase (AMP-forming)/AMP-acid ligase II